MKLIDVNQHLDDLISNKDDYKCCSLSVLDNLSDPYITFNDQGICNYYFDCKDNLNAFENAYKDKKGFIENKINQIKKQQGNNKYDCIIGLSGGVDSSYLCLYAKNEGLNPLIVHFDNGWNSELAQMNIEQIVTKLDFDLVTHVVDWDEFKLMQKALSVLNNTSDSNMTFNNNGTCNYYYDYLKYSKNFDKLYPDMERFISE